MWCWSMWRLIGEAHCGRTLGSRMLVRLNVTVVIVGAISRLFRRQPAIHCLRRHSVSAAGAPHLAAAAAAADVFPVPRCCWIDYSCRCDADEWPRLQSMLLADTGRRCAVYASTTRPTCCCITFRFGKTMSSVGYVTVFEDRKHCNLLKSCL